MTDPTPERFFFVHVHKAAGTSVRIRLLRHFARPQVYPDDSDLGSSVGPDGAPTLSHLAPTLLVSHLVERYRVRRREIVVVGGHFPLRTTEILGDRFTTFTVLRDPVERILSALRHHRALTPADHESSLEQLYEDPVRFHGMLHNHQVKMFSLAPDEIRAGDGMMTHVRDFTDARLADAKARLGAVDVVGVHDHVDDLCDELSARFGWRLGTPAHANATAPIPVPESFRRRIEADNVMDLELFEFARELTVDRRGRT